MSARELPCWWCGEGRILHDESNCPGYARGPRVAVRRELTIAPDVLAAFLVGLAMCMVVIVMTWAVASFGAPAERPTGPARTASPTPQTTDR